MAMQTQLWSINALSNELNMDRRTLSKKLTGLPAAETKRIGKRVEKRWQLADVVEHLNRQQQMSASPNSFPPVNGYRILHIEAIIHFVSWLTPKLWEEWNKDMTEIGMDEEVSKTLFKNCYFMLIGLMSKYLCGDVYNKRLKSENDGIGFDEMFALAHGEPITTSPPEPGDLCWEIPDFIKPFLTDNERKTIEDAGGLII